MRLKNELRLEKKEAEGWGYEIEESDATEQYVINLHKSEKIEKSNNVAPLYFAIDAGLPHKIQIVYRGDLRNYTAIFKDGLVSRGANPSLYLHVFPGEGSSLGLDSGFISTSTVQKSALRFPLAFPKREMIHQSFVYEITPSEVGRDVIKEIPKLATSSSDKAFYEVYCKRENEIAFLRKINPQDIKGAWPVEVYQGGLILPERITKNGLLSTGYYRLMDTEAGAYIHNPNYKEPIIPNLNDVNYNPKGAYIWNSAKYLGHGFTGIGAALDAQILYNEYQHSSQIHDFTNTYSEASRIVGGWAGASRLGILSAQKALIYSAPLSPLGQTAAVIFSGIAGSAVGYYFGGEATQWLYNMNRGDELIKPVYSENIRTSRLHGTITTMENSARIGRFTYNSTPAQDNNKAPEKPETEARQKHYFSNLMATIPAPTNAHPHDLYLSTLNQQTQSQSINQLFAASSSSIEPLKSSVITKGADVERLQNHLTGLQQSNASSTGMSKALTASSSSTIDLSQHLHNLASSQNTFTQAFTSTRVTDFSQFNQQSRPAYHFDTAQEASRYATFFSNYVYGDFSERPKPPSHNFSFFGGDNRGEGGRGWDRTCDSRYQDCSSSNPSDCRSSNSDRCTSSLFK